MTLLQQLHDVKNFTQKILLKMTITKEKFAIGLDLNYIIFFACLRFNFFFNSGIFKVRHCFIKDFSNLNYINNLFIETKIV